MGERRKGSHPVFHPENPPQIQIRAYANSQWEILCKPYTDSLARSNNTCEISDPDHYRPDHRPQCEATRMGESSI